MNNFSFVISLMITTSLFPITFIPTKNQYLSSLLTSQPTLPEGKVTTLPANAVRTVTTFLP